MVGQRFGIRIASVTDASAETACCQSAITRAMTDGPQREIIASIADVDAARGMNFHASVRVWSRQRLKAFSFHLRTRRGRISGVCSPAPARARSRRGHHTRNKRQFQRPRFRHDRLIQPGRDRELRASVDGALKLIRVGELCRRRQASSGMPCGYANGLLGGRCAERDFDNVHAPGHDSFGERNGVFRAVDNATGTMRFCRMRCMV